MLARWWQDFLQTLRLALPMILGFIGSMALLFVDGVMLGRLGVEPLAAYTLGGQIVSIFLVWGFGLSAGQHILGAAAFARGDPEETADVLQSGFVVLGAFGLAWGLAVHAFWPAWESLFIGPLHQDPALVDQARGYMITTTWAILPTLLYANTKAFLECQNRPWTPLLVYVPGMALNIFLNWVLIFGNLGAPAMGVTGAGLATLLAKVAMLLGLLAFAAYGKGILRPPRLLLRRPHRAGVRQFAGIGVITGFQSLLEHLMFVVMALFMGQFGAAALAAHNIAFRVGSFAFMIPLGISFAVSIRVAQAKARGDYRLVERIIKSGMAFTGVFMFLAAVAFVVARDPIAWVFYDERNAETIASVDLAKGFLLIMAIFQVFDGVQFVINGGLRGLKDVKLPTLLTLVNYWAIAVPVAYGLAFFTPLAGDGLWWGLLVGLALNAILLSWRLRVQLRRTAGELKHAP